MTSSGLAALVPPAKPKGRVFVSPSLAELRKLFAVANLDLVQIHGDLMKIF